MKGKEGVFSEGIPRIGDSFCDPNPHIQGKNMNKNMAPKLPNVPCFEAFGVVFCLDVCSYFGLVCGGRGSLAYFWRISKISRILKFQSLSFLSWLSLESTTFVESVEHPEGPAISNFNPDQEFQSWISIGSFNPGVSICGCAEMARSKLQSTIDRSKFLNPEAYYRFFRTRPPFGYEPLREDPSSKPVNSQTFKVGNDHFVMNSKIIHVGR